ncbi:hypothetical protein QT17_01840 [Thermus sp. 2.9]|jgi:hypothetical protein|uniref:Uncharacterized protein n=1 Tax=Thermus caliditerrae TaxID=1330700 RepID=A0A7C5RE38_9DEIN|nr:hypothetical protein [Thermus sp. 2.9]KHG66080.1 hypothetical protein QT17_01840 [Thermus sp. 2.9]
MRKRLQRKWAEVWGAYATALRMDEAIREAARGLEAHHERRLQAMLPLIPAPGAREDGLEAEYLDTLFQRHIARLYAGDEAG